MTGQLMISPPTVYTGNNFTTGHAMICKQRDYYSALQQAERPRGQTLEFCMQRCRGEQLSRAFNRSINDARLDIHTGGFQKRQCAAFYDMRVRHSNASSYQNKEPQQVSQIHENEKKRQYCRRILDVEKGTFTPLVFTTSSAMGIDWQSSFPQRKKSNIPQPSPG